MILVLIMLFAAKKCFQFLNYTKIETPELAKSGNTTMIACLDIFSLNNMFRIIREFINNEQKEVDEG